MKKIIDNLIRLILLWTIGALGGVFFSLLKIFGRIKVIDYEIRKFYPTKKGLIVIYNHPSLWEPGLMPFLLFPFFLFSSKFVSYSVPDRKNYFDKWWFFPIRLFCIPINRENGGARGLRELIKNVNEGKIVIVAPEGGRTHKGEEFKILKDGEILIKKKSELSPTENNPKIRRFQRSFSALLKFTEAPVLPIWAEGGDRIIPNRDSFPRGPYFLFPNLRAKTIIKIGERIEMKPKISQLEDILLNLSKNSY